MAQPKFVIFPDSAGEYRWRLLGGNSEIVAVSEGYTTEYSAERSAKRVKEIAHEATIVDQETINAFTNLFKR